MSKLIKNEQVIMGTPSHMDATKVTYNHETVQNALNRFGQDIWVNSQDIEELKKVPGVTIWDGLTEKKSFKQMMEEHFNKYGTGKDMIGFYRGGDREEQTYMPDLTSWMCFQFCIIGDQAKAICQDYYTRKIYTLEGTINPDWIEHNIYYRQWEELAKTNGVMKVYDAQEAFFNHREDINGFTLTDNCGAGRQYVVAFSELPGEPILHLIKTTDGGQTWRSVAQAVKKEDIEVYRYEARRRDSDLIIPPNGIYDVQTNIPYNRSYIPSLIWNANTNLILINNFATNNCFKFTLRNVSSEDVRIPKDNGFIIYQVMVIKNTNTTNTSGDL